LIEVPDMLAACIITVMKTPQKCLSISTEIHDAASQKMVIFILATMRT
jgi:hypothetical protein